MFVLLVVVDYFNFFDGSVVPVKTYAVLVINSNAVLSFSASLEFLKLIAGRRFEVFECEGCVEHVEFPLCGRPKGLG